MSAQGTLHAKKGEYELAQEYYRAALEKNPDSASVINNLALSYALDGKAEESEHLLRQAAASGHDDKRIRQNLALVLGVQGKFSEAREVASVDMTETQAKSSMSYLRNMDLTTFFSPGSFDMTRTFYTRPRRSLKVDKTDNGC